MCANRNKFAKRYVEEIFPLNILCCIIEDPESIATNAIEPFLKLVHMAYIDCQHYTPIRRIARVREWHTIEKKNDILRTHAEQSKLPENCDLKRIMDFIERYLRDFDYFDVRKRSDNQILYTILQVLKTTLRLGFWASITNLQDLLPNLLKICSCHKDFKEEIKSKHRMNLLVLL
jgi:inositol 1,4,5-triphosphate receptor type 1/inositol 1,4,5-triphosphate receptor type 3